MFDWFCWDEFGSIKLLKQAHELGACLFGLDVGAKLMSLTESQAQVRPGRFGPTSDQAHELGPDIRLVCSNHKNR